MLRWQHSNDLWPSWAVTSSSIHPTIQYSDSVPHHQHAQPYSTVCKATVSLQVSCELLQALGLGQQIGWQRSPRTPTVSFHRFV